MSTSSNREEAIGNAVKFLSDPKVKEAPLAKKIAFLESKGLSSSEIQSALNQVEGATTGAGTSSMIPSSSSTTGFTPQQYIQPPQPGQWKQTILSSLGVVSTGAALFYFAKMYLSPFFDIPTSKSIQNDTKSIQDQLNGSEKMLEQVTLSTRDLSKGLESHAGNVSSLINEMTSLLTSLRESDDKKTVELKLIKNEVEELKSTFPKLIEKTQETQTQLFDQIQSEIKSLKSLLQSRKKAEVLQNGVVPATNTSFSPSTSFAGVKFGSKPTIPAWQMSAKKNSPIITPLDTTNAEQKENSVSNTPATSLSIDDDVGVSTTSPKLELLHEDGNLDGEMVPSTSNTELKELSTAIVVDDGDELSRGRVEAIDVVDESKSTSSVSPTRNTRKGKGKGKKSRSTSPSK